MKIYHAVQPGRYLKNLVPANGAAADAVIIDPEGVQHPYRNQITGYKVVVNEDDMTYQTFLAKDDGAWQERRPLGPLSEATLTEIKSEVAHGHLCLD